MSKVNTDKPCPCETATCNQGNHNIDIRGLVQQIDDRREERDEAISKMDSYKKIIAKLVEAMDLLLKEVGGDQRRLQVQIDILNEKFKSG